jgi:hypothetical protein
MDEALKTALIEVLRANLFDGESGGMVHMPVDDLLSEAANIIVEDGRFALVDAFGIVDSDQFLTTEDTE